MRDALKRWPWYAAVLAAYPMLHVAVTNPGQVEAGDVLPVVAAGVAAAFGLVAVLRPVMGNWTAAGLGAAWVALLFYLYAPINEWWIDWVRAGLEQHAAEATWYTEHPQLAQSCAWCLIALAGLACLRLAAARIHASVPTALNLFAAILVALIAIQAVAHAAAPRAGNAEGAVSKAPQATAAAPGPDIYFIVLDGYARSDILSQYYQFDNSEFLDGLRAR